MNKPVILVADDMPLNFIVMEDLLSQAGCQPVFVTDGRQAVEKFQSQHYQLILMDLRMPVLDGLSATRLLREYEKVCAESGIPTKRTPVVMLSASLDARREARDAGCDDYLLKPLDRDMLWGVLSRHVGRVNPPQGLRYPAPGVRQPAAGYRLPGIR